VFKLSKNWQQREEKITQLMTNIYYNIYNVTAKAINKIAKISPLDLLMNQIAISGFGAESVCQGSKELFSYHRKCTPRFKYCLLIE
jgi:hypothetical protein